MPIRRFALAALLVAPVSAHSQMRPATPALAADTSGTFPRVEGTNLEGQHFTLPADFGAPLDVVLVAFKREQQEDVDSWTPHLKKILAGRLDVRVYELPTLGRGYRLMRSFIDGGMRRGIPDAAVRAATITLYIDKGPFREALRIPDEEQIHVLLVDRQGRVHWRAAGPFAAAAGAALAQKLDGMRVAP